MIKNYDLHENKISIYSNYAVHLGDQGRREKTKQVCSYLLFETVRTVTSSSLIDTRNNANTFIFIRLCTDRCWDALFTQHLRLQSMDLWMLQKKQRRVKNKNSEPQ